MSSNKAKEQQINIYNQFKKIKETATRKTISNMKSKVIPFNCYLVDNDWLKSWKNYINYNSTTSKKNNNKNNSQKKNVDISIKPCITLNTFEEVKDYIKNNKNFEIINEEFISSFDYSFTVKSHLYKKDIYFGFDKEIICFNEQNNIRYLLRMIKENKCYEFALKDKYIITKILPEKYENIFCKNSKFKNIKFIPLNEGNNTNNNNNIQSQYINNNTKNFTFQSINNSYINNPNLKNSTFLNNNSQNDIIEEINNKPTLNNNNKSININNNNNISQKASLKKEENPQKTSINIKEISQKSSNRVISNNESSSIEKEEITKEHYYAKEKERLLLQKKINESLLKDLDRANSIPKLLKRKELLEKEIEEIKKEIEEQNVKINILKREIELKKQKKLNLQKEEEKNGRIKKRSKSFRSQLKESQMQKRQELEDNYKLILLQDKCNELKKKIYIKNLTEEKLKEKCNDLNTIYEKIKKEYEFEKEFHKKQEFIKLILEQNQEELEKLNKINDYEEELRKVQKKLEEKERKKREEEIAKKIKEDERKQMEEEYKRKKEEEELIRIKKEKEKENEELKEKEELKELKRFEEEHNQKREEYLREMKRREKESQELIEKKREMIKRKRIEEQLKLQKDLEEEEKKIKQKIEEENLKKKKELEEFYLKKKEEEQIRIQNELLKQQQEKEERERQLKLQQQQIQEQEILFQQQNQKNIITCKSFKTPPLIGLENIGATCYMNATLQCMSQTEILTNYFLNENNINKILNNNIAKQNPNLPQLSPSYLNLINNLWKSKNKKWFSPTEFRKKIAIMNDLFKEGLPNDAKDLVSFILMQLHEELNLYNKHNNINNNANNIQNNLDQHNENLMLQKFVQEFFTVNRSVLSDHFFGITETKIMCSECLRKNRNPNQLPMKFNFQTFNFLIFPLEEVRIFRNNKIMTNNMNMNMINQMNINFMYQFNNNMNNMNNITNSVNIYDCFDYYQKEDIFNGENAMWCNDCKGLFESKNQTIIYTGPNILILMLNRGVGLQYKVKLEYYESINLDKYITKKDKISMIYDLYGVVTHLGESGDFGHFVASCKSPCDNNWYRYNDAIVNKISNIKSEVIDFGNSYILFYQNRQ